MIIETAQEHALSLAMVEELMVTQELGPERLGATEEAFLLVLVRAVEVYEKNHYPMPEPTPDRR